MKYSWLKLDRRITVLVGLLLFVNPLFGIENLAEQDQLSFERVIQKNGLNQLQVDSITQDSSGMLWIGSSIGTFEFDGYNFTQRYPSSQTTNNQSDSVVRDVLFLQNGDILSATDTGLDHINSQNRSRKLTIHDLRGLRILSIAKGKNGIYAGTNQGLFLGTMHRGDSAESPSLRFKSIKNTEHHSVHKIHQSSRGHVVVGTDKGLFVLVGNELVDVPVVALRQEQIRDITSDARGIWVATRNAGVFHLSSNLEKIKNYRHQTSDGEGEIAGKLIRALLVDSKSRLWVGTDKGLTIIQSNGRIKHSSFNPNNPNSLNHDLVRSIYEDTGGRIWVGTVNGLNLLDPSSAAFPLYNRHSTELPGLINHSITAFHESEDNTLWIGTRNGVAIWKSGSTEFRHLTSEELGLGRGPITSMVEKDGFIFIGTTERGIHVLSISELTVAKRYSVSSLEQQKRLPSNVVSAMLQSIDGKIWVGMLGGGVTTIDKSGEVSTPKQIRDASLLSSLNVTDLDEAINGEIWVGTLEGGVTIINAREASVRHLDIHSSKSSSLSSNDISSLNIHEGTAWIGTTDRGLNQYNLRSNSTKKITTANGIASNVIFQVEIDEKGSAWTSGPRGISVYDPWTETVRSFGSRHGLQGDDFNINASITLANGTMLFGGNNGFNAFDPAKIKLNTHKANTVITDFTKVNRKVAEEALVNPDKSIELNHKDNVIGFKFALMDFASPRDNTFQYRLIGFEDEWVDSGRERSATYTNLDAGRYTFEVRGINKDGLVTDKIASVKLNVAPPPWLTWYAYVAYCLATLILAAVFFRLYTQRIVRQTHERRNAQEKVRLEKLIAQRTSELNEKVKEQARTLHQKELANSEIHHRVKNNLQVILSLISLQADSESDEKFHEAMSHIKQRINSMALIHESLYQHNVTSISFKQYAENLIKSIQSFYEEVANGNIKILLDIDNEVLDIDSALPAGLILNELVTNSIKHGFANNHQETSYSIIKIGFHRSEQDYVLTLSDNGHGLPDSFSIDSPSSMGGELIAIFAQQLEGSISAANQDSGGAAFKLVFPASDESNAASRLN